MKTLIWIIAIYLGWKYLIQPMMNTNKTQTQLSTNQGAKVKYQTPALD